MRTLISLSADDDTLLQLQEELGRYASTAPGLFLATLGSLDTEFVRVDCQRDGIPAMEGKLGRFLAVVAVSQ